MLRHNLGALVKVGNYSGEAKIIGRAEYLDRPNLYLCKFLNNDGLPVEQWIEEDDIS